MSSAATAKRQPKTRQAERQLTVREIAAAEGVQPGQVRRWIEDGCPVAVKGGPGKSALLDRAAVRAWRAQRQQTVSVAEESAGLKNVQRRKAELELRHRAGDLLDRADVDRVWRQHITDAKTLLEALPRAEASRCVAAARTGGEAAVAAVLGGALRRVLTALAGGPA
jgi:phage terminase Nu1 subunit (DNA packaging protein)